jgi:hypothetical protein
VTSTEAPGQLEKGAQPVAASVIRFMQAIQQESGNNAVAENYVHHAEGNPHFSDRSIGEYSFDVHPWPTADADPNTGFYDPDKAFKYFEAVERASQKPDINMEWWAFYNDAKVIEKFNKAVGKGRIWFIGGSGGGTHHHGPEPYILHIHFNVMPKDLAARYLATRDLLAEAHKIFEAFLKAGALF